jgi:predicted O-methyltransferase YrrM
MNRNLEKYIFDHITLEDPVLEDLYRQTHIRFVNPNMASGHLQGKLLEFISFMIKPQRILEIGTFTGYSAICLAKGLAPEGKLITIEINDELSSFSHSYFVKAGLENKIEQITGDALEIIPRLEMNFDLVFIDADKRDYCEYFNIVKDKLSPEGIILADNVLWGGAVLDYESNDPQLKGIREFNDMISRDTDIEKTIIPVRDGLTVIRKKN